MRIALVTNALFPDGLGGTELYSFQLANALIQNGHEVFWFVPNYDSAGTVYEERGNGIKIIKFTRLDDTLRPSLAVITTAFITEIKARNIQVAHFNEFGGDGGVSPTLLTALKKESVITIVTLHLAAYFCQTGTLHYGAVEPCNGKMILERCSSCHLLSGITSSASVNLNLTRLFYNILKTGSPQQIPKIKKFIAGIDLKSVFISLLREHADMVVSLTHWFKEVLLINGISEHKIAYIPQISPQITPGILQKKNDNRNGYVFIGRVNKEKGIDLILNLASKLKKALPDVFIDLYGPYLPTDGIPHTIIPELENFSNIRYRGVLNPDDVLAVMDKYKAVILPSRVAEMAPLIIMEANELKVPVIASDVPGSVELIRQFDCGLIFKYGSADDLFRKIQEIENKVQHFSFKKTFENNFNDTAQKYIQLYEQCLNLSASN